MSSAAVAAVGIGLAWTMFAHGAWADASADDVSLDRMQRASRTLDYAGVFVYQTSGRMQSSRITHQSGHDGPHEKLEVLDGQPREVLRDGDETRCLIPATKTVLVERGSARDAFPALVQSNTAALSKFYRSSVAGVERVAGFECDAIVLEPRDRLRYGYRLCAERKTGLLLKAQTFNERGDLIEQIAFSEVRIGEPIATAALQPSWDTRAWRVEQASGTAEALVRWAVPSAVPGFQKVRELRRSVEGRPDVGQFVFSDGLAAISVFIEPWHAGLPAQDTTTAQGALNMLSQRRGEWLVTVLGEVPAASIRKFADAVQLNPSN